MKRSLCPSGLGGCITEDPGKGQDLTYSYQKSGIILGWICDLRTEKLV